MDDNVNKDLGNFLHDNDMLPGYEDPVAILLSPNKYPDGKWDLVGEFQDSNDNLAIRLDGFVAIDDLWDDLDLGALTNEQPLKPKFLSIGNKVNRYNPHNLQITCKIGFVNFNPYIDPISSFNENIGLEEDLSKGILWFNIRDDKTIFNMPRAERRLMIPGDTRLLNRSFARIHLLQLSFEAESDAQGSLLF
ncbi:hypothetical protein Tco_1046554 [Tanacetum coccineum]